MKYLFVKIGLLLLNLSFQAQAQSALSLNQALSLVQKRGSGFEENKGQIKGPDANQVRYFYENDHLSIFLLPTRIAYQFHRVHYPEAYLDSFSSTRTSQMIEKFSAQSRTESYRMDVELLGANPQARISVEGKSADYVHYYTENVMAVHRYSSITYHEIYPNIDWVLYEQPNGGLKYDFIVRPGGNPKQIRLKTHWVEDLSLNPDGGIKLQNRLGSITEKAPVSLQGTEKIKTRFVEKCQILQFELGAYDPTQILIIDPSLTWSTYYGGAEVDWGYSCSTDALGHIYLAGSTRSLRNIAVGGYQNSLMGSIDAYLVKFNAGTGRRIWASYYGGADIDQGLACATDVSGHVYLAGHTRGEKRNLAFDGHQNQLGGGTDAFLVKFDATGMRIWASYYGGIDVDEASSCATDKQGNVYLAGYTKNANGIATSGHQPSFGGVADAFLVKFNAQGQRLWASYYGGTNFDAADACTTDALGNVYLAGRTQSQQNIALNGHQNNHGGGSDEDAFLVKFSPEGLRLWATYYGGNRREIAYSCATDAMGNVYLAGETGSTSGIAAGGHQNSYSGGTEAFLVKFNASGIRQWATYYGDSAMERAFSCTVDASGNIYLAGETGSRTRISSGGHQNTFGGQADAFLVKFNTAGLRQWATYYGQANMDIGRSCTTDGTHVYLVGTTSGTALASGEHQNNFGGQVDAFLVKFQQ